MAPKKETVEVETAQQDGTIEIYDPYAPARGGEERTTYTVKDHVARVHPDHVALVEGVVGGEKYQTDREAAEPPVGRLSATLTDKAADAGGSS